MGLKLGAGEGLVCLGLVLEVLLVVVLVVEELRGLESEEMQWLGRLRRGGGGVGRDGDRTLSLNRMSVKAKTGGGGEDVGLSLT